MKRPASLLTCLILSVLVLPEVRAGLAEATDNDLAWTTGSSSSYEPGSREDLWVEEPGAGVGGEDDVAVGRLGGTSAETSWMFTSITGPTTLYYSYRVEELVSSYGGTFNGPGGVQVSVDGGSSEIITTGWKEVAVSLPAGVHTARWQLNATRGFLGGRVYVDQVWTDTDPRPRITSMSTTGAHETPMNWPVSVTSATPFTIRASGLPPGLVVAPDQLSIAGKPSRAGVFQSFITAENTAGKHTAQVTFTIDPGTTDLGNALDMPAQEFTQNQPGIWAGVTGLGMVDNDCARVEARSWPEAEWPKASLYTNVDGPGTLSFWYYLEGAIFPERPDFAQLMLFVGPQIPANIIWVQTGNLTRNEWVKFSIDIPPGRQRVALKPYRLTGAPGDPGTGTKYAYVDGMSFVSRAVEIEVTAGTPPVDIPDGSNRSFGTVLVGNSVTQDFVIRNANATLMTGLGTTIQGPDASNFTIVKAPVSPVTGPGGSTTLSVRFSPAGTGVKTATVRIESTDIDENPFDIALVGYGTTLASQPTSQSAGLRDRVVFSAGSNAPGATYQWRKDGRDILGAVGPSLVLPSVEPWQMGEYSVVVTSSSGTELSDPASLRLAGIPEGPWRGLVSYYPFDGHSGDVLRLGMPAELVNGAVLASDPERGGVASMNGKGFMVPPDPSESLISQGPGGYLRIPRPIEAKGESFTISFWVKENGYSSWHGESFLTLGEGAAAPALVGHYWIGGSPGLIDHFGAIGTLILETVPPNTAVVAADGSAVISQPTWKDWTIVASGETLSFYSQGEYRGNLPYPTEVPGDVFIGRHWWISDFLRYSTRFQGQFDDLRFYNRALTAAEVRQLHIDTRPAPPSSAYDTWAASNGLSGPSADLGEDPDGDGWTNGDEYLFGTHPRLPTPESARFVKNQTTQLLEWIGRRDTRYAGARSDDLRTWRPLDQTVAAAQDQSGVPSGYERLEVELPRPSAIGAALGAFRVEGLIAPFFANAGILDTQPRGGEALAGTPVVLGPAAGLPWETYQWLYDGIPLPGATESTLRLPSVVENQSGFYQLIVSNALGTARSRESFLRVTAPGPASVVTSSLSATGPGQVTVEGMVLHDGGQPVLERGVVQAATANPTIETGITLPSGHGPGAFQATRTGLASGSVVHVRAYARTAHGVAYGENLTLTLPAGP